MMVNVVLLLGPPTSPPRKLISAQTGTMGYFGLDAADGYSFGVAAGDIKAGVGTSTKHPSSQKFGH